jgi:hypothetical protein
MSQASGLVRPGRLAAGLPVHRRRRTRRLVRHPPRCFLHVNPGDDAEAVLLEANCRLEPAASIGACAGHSTSLRLLRLLETLAGNRMPRV